MFAFLLYDAPNQRVIAARDHFGIKPLYCYADDRRVALRLRDQGPAPSSGGRRHAGLHRHAGLPDVPVRPGRRTLFDGIRKLPPGHFDMIDLRSGR